MSRSRKAAKNAGTAMETAVQDYLRWALDDERIQRLSLHGNKDIGDIGNVYLNKEPVTIEVKNTTKLEVAKHLREAQVEAGNNDSPYPILIQKRIGINIDTTEKTGQQLVLMTLETFARILNHGLPLGPEEGEII